MCLLSRLTKHCLSQCGPSSFFVCRQVLHVLLQDLAHEERTDVQSISARRHVAYTLAIFLSSVAIVMKVESLGMVMSITGNVAGSTLGYILPGLIALSPTVRERVSRDEGGPGLEGNETAIPSSGNALKWLGTSPEKRGPSALVLFGAVAAILGVSSVFL